MAVRRSEGVRSPRTTFVGALVQLAALLVLSLMLTPRAEAYLYWTNATSASDYSIGRADLDGTGVKQRFIAVNNVGAYARDVTLDADHVYWAAACFSDAPGSCTSGAIGRAEPRRHRRRPELDRRHQPGQRRRRR